MVTIHVPDRIAAAARARIERSTRERERVMHEVMRGCPLDAEPVIRRRVAYIQRAAGVSRADARRLARHVKPEELGLTGESLLRATAVQGDTADFLGLSFLELARSAANAVCRLATPDGTWHGTGFMVSSRLMLTNNHVIRNEAAAAALRAEFDYEVGVDGRERPVTRCPLDPAAFFVTNDDDDLDFTLVAVSPSVDGGRPLEQIGFCPLRATDDKHLLGRFVNVVQHPKGEPKQIVLRENRLVTRLKTVLHYTADTDDGASGSPVFNDRWEVVALHHWGEPFREVRLPDGSMVPRDVNEGIRISAIVRALARMRDTLDGERQSLLDVVLEASSGN